MKIFFRVISILLFAFAFVWFSDLFWPKSWGIGFAFLLDYLKPKGPFFFVLIGFVCVLMWMGAFMSAEYFWKKK